MLTHTTAINQLTSSSLNSSDQQLVVSICSAQCRVGYHPKKTEAGTCWNSPEACLREDLPDSVSGSPAGAVEAHI